MKKLTTILFALFILSGCKVPVYTIGMTETEFKAHNRMADVVELTPHRTVYKKPDHFDEKNRMHYKYFYFEDGKLVRLDEGERKPDIIIEHTSN